MDDVDHKRLYREKREWLEARFEEVAPYDFYRDIFPVGSFERQGRMDDKRPNGIAIEIAEDARSRRSFVHDSLEEIEGFCSRGAEVVMSPIGYIGKARTLKNAWLIYALTIDFDGVDSMEHLIDVFHQMESGYTPTATYVVHSGHGLHMYYVFDEPVRMTKEAVPIFNTLKRGVTRRLYNKYTTTQSKQPQHQSINQPFRLVGTPSKLGRDFPVRAYRIGDGRRVDPSYLNGFVSKEYKVDVHLLDYSARLSIYEAKRLYPEWYEKRIDQNIPAQGWVVKEALYQWWLRKLEDEVIEGHRYHGIMTLAAYAKKCRVPRERLEADAYGLKEHLDGKTKRKGNNFTDADIAAALKYYDDPLSYRFSRRQAEHLTGVPIPPNKRNYQNQIDHLEEARAIRDIRMKRQGIKWDDNNGRKPKRDDVWRYLVNNPEARKVDVIRGTGLSKKTVYKYYDSCVKEIEESEAALVAMRKKEDVS